VGVTITHVNPTAHNNSAQHPIKRATILLSSPPSQHTHTHTHILTLHPQFNTTATPQLVRLTVHISTHTYQFAHLTSHTTILTSQLTHHNTTISYNPHTHIHTHTCAHIHTHTHTHTHSLTHTHTHTLTHTPTHTHTQTHIYLSKTRRTPASDSPTYLFSNSGPRTERKFAST
jgi:hypothetical protein